MSWLNRVRVAWISWRYFFRHWPFQWKVDKDGDLCFVVANRLTFVKYKEHTIIQFNGNKLKPAGKWQGHAWREHIENECVHGVPFHQFCQRCEDTHTNP